MKKLLYNFLLFPCLMIAQSSYTVIVGPGMTFVPSVLTISQGDMVTWISEGGTHDVNFNINSITGESFANPEEIASSSLPFQSLPGEMGSITFNDLGTFNYDCSIGSHAAMGMVGVILVEPSDGIIDFYPPGGSSYNTDSTEITLPSAFLGVNYNQTIEIDIPEFLTIDLNGEVIDLPINFIEIIDVTTPNEMTYFCSNEDCYFGSNTSGDITLLGTPSESGFNELAITYILSFNGTPLDIPTDLDITLPYTGGNILLDSQLQGDFSAFDEIIPTFYLNVEGGGQVGCTNPEATNYNFNAIEDDGSCEYNIFNNDIITTCGGTFYDSGGPSGNYLNFENNTITIYPENDDEFIFLNFYEFTLESAFYDNITIYDGINSNSPILINAIGSSDLLGETIYASPTNETGALHVSFSSDASITYPGWAAEIGCTTYGPCDGFSGNVTTSFESEEGMSDASASLEIVLGNGPYEIIWSTGATSESINGLSSGSYSVIISDSEGCETETYFDIVVDPEQYLIGDIINLNTCNGLFYDSGGAENNFETGENYFIRICPDEDGFVSQLDFTDFDIGFDGPMIIYDGTGTASPVLTTAYSNDLLGQVITATDQNSSGCLTITFVSSFFWGGSPGWEAYISCYDYIVYGCMIDSAFNYNPDAEEDDNSCYYAPGCTNPLYAEYYSQGFNADHDNGDCEVLIVDDCFNETALNFNPYATFNLGEDPCVFSLEEWSCGMYYKDFRDGYSYPTQQIGNQCWMTENIRYQKPDAFEVPSEPGGVVSLLDSGFVYTGIDSYNLFDNGRYYNWNSAASAVPYSWHLPSAQEFQILLSNYDGISLQQEGESGFSSQMSGGAVNPNDEMSFINQGNTNWLWTSSEVDLETAISVTIIVGSEDVLIDPFPKPFAISVRALFGFPSWAILGCTDQDYIEYNPNANYDDGTCQIILIEGCTDETALNYDSVATFDNGSCIDIVEGCMDSNFIEYDSLATIDDGSCEIFAVNGCMDETSLNYNELATLDDGSCIDIVEGCMDEDFIEFNILANQDDGSCNILLVLGCTDPLSTNYNPAANSDNGSCLDSVLGCTDQDYLEYNYLATIDDGSCFTINIFGCTIDYALNFNPLANSDNGTCQVEGCTNDLFIEFDPNANIDNGTCLIIAIPGCMDPNYLEYFLPANIDDGSCFNIIIPGCTNPIYLEYFFEANIDDGSCQTIGQVGCTDPNFIEYDPLATVDINTCLTPVVFGCMNPLYIEYQEQANVDDSSCQNLIIMGCTNSYYYEYDSLANLDDGSCISIILEGCMDDNFIEFNPLVNLDNGSCNILVVLGCTDPFAFNFDELANTDDDNCIETILGCLDTNFIEYDPNANTEDPVMCVTPVILGCTNPEAYNYSPLANTNDGSCVIYFAEISFVVFSNGLYQFYSNVEGLGNDYQEFWSFGDGNYSSEYNPMHTYIENDSVEVILSVSNGQVEIVTTILIEVVNASLSIESIEDNKSIFKFLYFDILGQNISKNALKNNQIYIENIIYDDGSYKYMKRIHLH